MSMVDAIPLIILGSIVGTLTGYLVYHSMTCKHCGKKVKE